MFNILSTFNASVSLKHGFGCPYAKSIVHLSSETPALQTFDAE